MGHFYHRGHQFPIELYFNSSRSQKAQIIPALHITPLCQRHCRPHQRQTDGATPRRQQKQQQKSSHLKAPTPAPSAVVVVGAGRLWQLCPPADDGALTRRQPGKVRP